MGLETITTSQTTTGSQAILISTFKVKYMHMLHIPHKVEVLLWLEAQLAERKKGVVLWVVVEEGVGQLVLSLAGKKSVNGTIRKKKPLTHRDKKNNIIAAYKS